MMGSQLEVALMSAKYLHSFCKTFDIIYYLKFDDKLCFRLSSFRQGKIFTYDLSNQDSKAFQNFALGWYKNVPSKSVPSPKTPL
jgi:hypothetical protein